MLLSRRIPAEPARRASTERVRGNPAWVSPRIIISFGHVLFWRLRRGFGGKQTTPLSKRKRLLLSASFCKGFRLCPTLFLKQQGCPRFKIIAEFSFFILPRSVPLRFINNLTQRFLFRVCGGLPLLRRAKLVDQSGGGSGKQTTPFSECKRLPLSASFCKGYTFAQHCS